MVNICISCERNPVKGNKLLCHSCGVSEQDKEVERIDLQHNRDFKFDMRRALQEVPALRRR